MNLTPPDPVPDSWRASIGMLILAAGGRIEIPAQLVATLDPDRIMIRNERGPDGSFVYTAVQAPRVTDDDLHRLIDGATS